MPTPTNPPDPLDPLFEGIRNAAPEPSDFLESNVWRRIAAAEHPPAGRRSGWAAIEEMFARTSFTAAFVAACVLLGLFLAETRVSQLQARRSVQFVQSYLGQIDPMLEGAGPERESSAARP